MHKRLKGYLADLFHDRDSRLFIACWVAYTATYLGRLNFSAALSAILIGGDFTKTQMGLVGTCFFAAYGAGQIFMTLLGKKISSQSGILCALLFSALCNIGFAFSKSATALCLVWSVNGLAQSVTWPLMIRLFAENLPIEKRMNACININTTVPIGTILTYLLTGFLVQYFSWRIVFYAGAVSLILAALFWAYIFKTTELYEEPIAVKPARVVAKLKFKLSSAILIFCVAVLMQGMLRDGVITWVPSLAIEIFSLPASAAVTLTLLLPIVNLSGAYIARFFNTRIFKNEASVCALLFAIATGSVLLLMLPLPGAIYMYILLAIATTSLLGINTMLISVVPTYFSAMRATANISALLNAMAYVGSALSGLGFGYLSDTAGWGATIAAWGICGACGTIACLLAIRVWDKYLKVNSHSDANQ